MLTVSTIKEKLGQTRSWEAWMDELEEDPRKSVQTLLRGWKKKVKLSEDLKRHHLEKVYFDNSFKKTPGALLAGIDEAGRGPLAGPVVTAAVILPDDCSELLGVDDSKGLTRDKRNRFASLIKEKAVSYAIHIQSPAEIDRLNIYQATKQSMAEAVKQLDKQPAVLLADAMQVEAGIPCHSIIKGDAKSLAIGAASILAKTERDALMDAYALQYPDYGFDQHAGYGTPVHLESLRRVGPCAIHRKSFEPVKSLSAGN